MHGNTFISLRRQSFTCFDEVRRDHRKRLALPKLRCLKVVECQIEAVVGLRLFWLRRGGDITDEGRLLAKIILSFPVTT